MFTIIRFVNEKGYKRLRTWSFGKELKKDKVLILFENPTWIKNQLIEIPVGIVLAIWAVIVSVFILISFPFKLLPQLVIKSSKNNEIVLDEEAE